MRFVAVLFIVLTRKEISSFKNKYHKSRNFRQNEIHRKYVVKTSLIHCEKEQLDIRQTGSTTTCCCRVFCKKIIANMRFLTISSFTNTFNKNICKERYLSIPLYESHFFSTTKR